MKKAKLKDRIDNAIDALFDNSAAQDEEIAPFGAYCLADLPGEVSNQSDRSKVFTVLRQGFLFLPGTFVLWIISAELTYRFFMNGGGNPKIAYVIPLIAFFLPLLGLGDVRRIKDYVIPASIMSVGALTAMLSWLTGSNILLGIWFFPLALIAPFIAKMLIDGTE